ncbi:MAG: hypothetical protein HYX27_01850 [Acidobacteria bacterium]|nr:hypothetical protein [Acidobacteriota bacterium]
MSILHVWVKGPGGWKLVARHATRLNPSFSWEQVQLADSLQGRIAGQGIGEGAQ